MYEFELRRVGKKQPLVHLLIPGDANFSWEPEPHHAPIGPVQWYIRELGKARWMKCGPKMRYA